MPSRKKSKQENAPTSGTADGLRGLRAALLCWYDANKRDLPWRHTRDPYAIWISEAMLQQTRVETVIPYWERFLARFPDVKQLADAPLDDVYAVWTGLGYYSRARNLQHAAQTVVNEHDGRLPETVAGLQSLKGIGRYMAGAIASIAFELEAPLVDGNVIRVFARLLDIRSDTTEKKVLDRMWQIASELVPGERPGDFNQALMELGATVCTPRSPDCATCPLVRDCKGHQAGDVELLPIKKKKVKPVRMRAIAVLIERDGKILAVRRPETGLMAGLWELPGGTLEAGQKADQHAERIIAEAVGLRLGKVESVGQVQHLFTHRRLTLEVFRSHAPKNGRVRRKGFVAHKWISPDALLELAHAGPTRKALALLGHTDEESARAARAKNE